MNKQHRNTIPAFTIFEVTVVLAIMSVIAAMVTFSTNRLFDQMHIAEEIHAELDNFYKVRSTLWYDCVMADSVVFREGTVSTYQENRIVQYSIQEDQLFRNLNGQQEDLKIGAIEIISQQIEGGEEIVLTFNWKGEELPWRFYNRPDVAGSVNQYFDRRDG